MEKLNKAFLINNITILPEKMAPNMSANRTAQNNKELYMRKHGIQIELPSLYRISCIVYPINPRYCLQLLRYCIPSIQYLKTNDHHHDNCLLNQELLIKSYKSYKNCKNFSEDILPKKTNECKCFKDKDNGLVFRLLYERDHELLNFGEIIFENAVEALMKISECSQYFVIVFKKL